MTRWIAAPLVALTALVFSGFLSELETMTEESAALARSSASAPRTTQAAAEEVEDLPQLADLTTQQAKAFAALADALEISAQRVEDFNALLAAQQGDLAELARSMASFDEPLDCVDRTLNDLLASSRATPGEVRAITTTLSGITDAQNKAIRHLKSLNRKLAALGALATASGVDPPRGPEGGPARIPDFDPRPLEC